MQLAKLKQNLNCLLHLCCYFFKHSLCVHFDRSLFFDWVPGIILQHQPRTTVLWPRSIYPLNKSQRPECATWFTWTCLCGGSFFCISFVFSEFAVGGISWNVHWLYTERCSEILDWLVDEKARFNVAPSSVNSWVFFVHNKYQHFTAAWQSVKDSSDALQR